MADRTGKPERKTGKTRRKARKIKEPASDHKRVENALGESERRYRELFENIRSGAAVYEAIDNGNDFILRDFNRAACAIEGVSKEAVIGKKLTEAFPGVGAFGLLEVLRRVWKTGAAEHYPATFYKDEKHSGWRENYIYKLPSGEVVAIYDDVTERKEIALELEEKEHYFRSLLYGLHEDIVVIDRDMRITDLNDSVQTTTGQKREDIIGRHCYEVLRGTNRPCYENGEECRLEDVFATRRSCNMHHQHIRADGTKADIDILMSPMKDADGNVTHVVEVARDVSDLFRAQDALRESEERYRSLFESSASGITYFDPTGRLIMANKVAVSFVGGKPANHVGKLITEILPGEIGEMVLRRIKRVMRLGHAEHHDTTGEFPPGLLQLYSTYMPVRNAEEQIVGVQVISEDVTERRRLEAQLRQAQKMEAIGQLAGGIAHDFRNQLTIIRGFAGMILKQGLLNNEGAEKMQEIIKAADRSTNLTSQLLAFSRRNILRPRIVSLAELVSDLGKSLPQMIGEDIRLSIIPGGRDCYTNVDPDQLHQALVNLAINARDAMPDGGLLTIETDCTNPSREFFRRHRNLKPGKYAGVTVSDTGIGMDSRTKERIFEPFFTTKEPGRGTGLGLSMTYGFVTQSGGVIECDSAPGKGTTFRMYFPCAASPSQDDCPASQQ